MDFEIVGEITDVETFAINAPIRDLPRCGAFTGQAVGGSKKGVARVRLADGSVFRAEILWYEAHAVGAWK